MNTEEIGKIKKVVHIATIFPGYFDSIIAYGNIARALEKKLLEINIHDLRDYTDDPHGKVDDRPYGGGAGMVMKAQPFFSLCMNILGASKPEECREKAEIILLTPRGRVFNQEIAGRLAVVEKPVFLLCGRYEGVDNRVAEVLATDEISIGDYILSGGEPAAVVILDVIARLIPGVVGTYESIIEESFSDYLLEYPQYTRPESLYGYTVPKVLLTGNHRLIDSWRMKMRIADTKERRPDLFEKALSNEDLRKIIDNFLTNRDV
jgi:tRNA (guanine37-N1)-methyltransferase